MHRAADVHGGENREDEGLQERHQHLEAGERDQHERREAKPTTKPSPNRA